MNQIVIKGRLVRNPELKEVQVKDGAKSVCNFDVAVNRRFGEETDFFRCQAWAKTAEFVNKFFQKGQEVLLYGGMQSKKYKDKDGNDRIGWQINCEQVEFCGSKKDNQDANQAGIPDGFIPADDDDDIPF